MGGPDFPSLFVMLEVHFNNEKLQSGVKGGFQLEFERISQVINYMTCYKFEWSHWLKLQHSDWRANHVEEFF